MRIEILDLEFQQAQQVIASFLLFGDDGPVLVETGPGSTLSALISALASHGVAPGDVRHVLLSHIHLDHAGAAGWWAQQGAQIYVHPRGAPHLVDPSKLLASAQRIYGDRMDSLWGEILPAPSERVTAVGDGEVIDAGGLGFVAIETPGHARHHHAYALGDVAFVGDAMGIRIPGSDWLDLPAPPPEFDLETWKETLIVLEGKKFATVYRTHFGPSSEVSSEADRLAGILDETTGFVGTLVDRELGREEMLTTFEGWVRGRLSEAGADDERVQLYEVVNPRGMSVDGIVRYWRKRVDRA
ncbi:MAG: MBL fold metallo-hydrolase [Acidobacteriota bacterium]|nr:MBL fold metallo-hydrolase [Acidobacteriota bacterium]